LDDAQKFRRWDIISYEWSMPKEDGRLESRRIKHRSLKVEGYLHNREDRIKLIAPLVTSSLAAEERKGLSFAFLRPQNPRFFHVKKSSAEYASEKQRFRVWHEQEASGLFGALVKPLVPYEPAPYHFKYRYYCMDGEREGTCQDWEMEATFLKWRRIYGESETLRRMALRFGEEYQSHGFVFAMGTHKAYGNWLINGVVKLLHGAEDVRQPSLF
jgi:hypothetical protein